MTGGPYGPDPYESGPYGPGPKWESMDPWSMFCPHPNNSGNYNIELVQVESLRSIWGEGRRLRSFSVFLSIETKC